MSAGKLSTRFVMTFSRTAPIIIISVMTIANEMPPNFEVGQIADRLHEPLYSAYANTGEPFYILDGEGRTLFTSHDALVRTPHERPSERGRLAALILLLVLKGSRQAVRPLNRLILQRLQSSEGHRAG